MRIRFGRAVNNTIRSGAYERMIRIALAVLIVMTIWAGPYNLIKIQDYTETVGELQAYDIWRVRGWRHSSDEADIYIEIILDGEKYGIDMGYVEQDVHLLAGSIDDQLGDVIRIKHIDDWGPLSGRRLITGMHADGDALFDETRMKEIWNQKAVQDMWIGLTMIILGGLFWLVESGRIRIVGKEEV